VAADDRGDARLALDGTLVERLDLTVAVAAVADAVVAVVARFAVREDAVAAIRVFEAGPGGQTAGEAGFARAVFVATVVGFVVAVVAVLRELDGTVATAGAANGFTKLAGDGAGESRLDLTVLVATVLGFVVAVVAGFTAADRAVAADERGDAWLTWLAADVVVLDTAHARAAVARSRVAVVAGFTGREDAVAADPWDHAVVGLAFGHRGRTGRARTRVARRAVVQPLRRSVRRGCVGRPRSFEMDARS